MPDPGKELFKMLAQSTLRIESINTLHKSHVASIPARHQQTLASLEDLRQRITTAGVGADPEAEESYLGLLADAHHYDQSWMMHSGLLEEVDPSPLTGEMAKALLYGEMLLDVYGRAGNLVKGACEDLQAIATRLEGFGYPESDDIAARLRELIDD